MSLKGEYTSRRRGVKLRSCNRVNTTGSKLLLCGTASPVQSRSRISCLGGNERTREGKEKECEDSGMFSPGLQDPFRCCWDCFFGFFHLNALGHEIRSSGPPRTSEVRIATLFLSFAVGKENEPFCGPTVTHYTIRNARH